MSARHKRVFTIPPSVAFLKELVQAIFRGGFPTEDLAPPTAESLARWTILVPTRRAARTLEQIFLDLSAPRKALLLPRIRPIGDVDEDVLDLGLDAITSDDVELEPAISSLGREFLLASLIDDWAKNNPQQPLAQEIAASPDQAVTLARGLAELIDNFETEDIDFRLAPSVYDIDLALHREAILDFMRIATERFPGRLIENGLIGAMKRRNLLIRREAERLAREQLGDPIVAAGSTGTIPATAILLRTIAELPRGAVVLPGLDLDMDDECWESVGAEGDMRTQTHAQFGMKCLLGSMRIERQHVEVLPGLSLSSETSDRAWLCSEILRPTEVAGGWQVTIAQSASRIQSGLQGIELIEAANRREEAAAIALVIRKEIATPGTTIALVTPDRVLAQRVMAELKRWNIDADDSAGQPLIHGLHGSFIALLLELADDASNPAAWAALVHHPFARWGLSEEDARRGAQLFDLIALRYGQWKCNGSLPDFIKAQQELAGQDRHLHPALTRVSEQDWALARTHAANFEACVKPLIDAALDADNRPLKHLVNLVIRAAESAAAPIDLWTGDHGEALSKLFIAVRDEADQFPRCRFSRARVLIRDLLRNTPVRKRVPGGARLAILGLIEARLVRASLMILGGLNEGTWPAQPDAGPWLNRPMRSELGLPAPEHQIGYAAHDFVQGLGAERVVLAWSQRVDDAPATPSRWVLRLKMLMGAAKAQIAASGQWLAWARGLDHVDTLTPVKKPEPKPPARLSKLSVTEVETLYRDPYAIYARHLLKLLPLEGFARKAEPSERGQLVHEVLHRVMQRYPTNLPVNAVEQFIAIGLEVFGERLNDPDIAGFWWPRFKRIATWFVSEDQHLRRDAQAILTERSGSFTFDVAGQEFSLTGRADRIDVLSANAVRIIDYKTGSIPSGNQVKVGFAPQLTLEAAMIEAGGFRDVPALKTAEILYMKVSGGEPAGEVKVLEVGDPMKLAAEHLAILRTRLEELASGKEAFVPRRAFESVEDASGYDHLSRFAEWDAA